MTRNVPDRVIADGLGQGQRRGGQGRVLRKDPPAGQGHVIDALGLETARKDHGPVAGVVQGRRIRNREDPDLNPGTTNPRRVRRARGGARRGTRKIRRSVEIMTQRRRAMKTGKTKRAQLTWKYRILHRFFA